MCKFEVNLNILQKKTEGEEKEMLNRCKLTEIEVTFSEDGDVANVDCDFKKKHRRLESKKRT